jgi:hypothetical protein
MESDDDIDNVFVPFLVSPAIHALNPTNMPHQAPVTCKLLEAHSPLERPIRLLPALDITAQLP